MKSRKINNLLNIKSRKNKIKNNSTRRENFSNSLESEEQFQKIVIYSDWIQSYLTLEPFKFVKNLEKNDWKIMKLSEINIDQLKRGKKIILCLTYDSFDISQLRCENITLIYKIDDLYPYNEIRNKCINYAEFLISPYQYLFKENKIIQMYPSINFKKSYHIPYSAVNSFYKNIDFNDNPKEKIFVSGNINNVYPLRQYALQFKQYTERLEHPSYNNYKHRIINEEYYKKLSEYLCCFTDASCYNYILLKVFEICSVGSLLLCDDSIKNQLYNLGFHDNIHYIACNKDNMELKMKWILDNKNRKTVDEIRLRGMSLVRNNHSTNNRSDLFNTIINNKYFKQTHLAVFNNDLYFTPDKIQVEYINSGRAEPYSGNINIVNDYIKQTKRCHTYLDIGVNIATHSIVYSKIFKSVISFEPDDYNYNQSKENLLINNVTNVKLLNKALGSKKGFVKTEKHSNHSRGCIFTRLINDNKGIEQITLDSLKLNNIDYIKIDVEEHELDVMQGAVETIKSNKPIIEFKYNGESEKFNVKYDDIKTFLNNLNYRFDKQFESNFYFIYDNTNSNKKIFSNIYKNGIWNNNNQNIPLSGPGSTLNNTIEVSSLLEEFIYRNKCTSILDLGCGDLTWMSKTKFFLDNNIQYIGIDVVPDLINSHKMNYPDNTFLCKDITEFSEFSKVSMIILRDVIFHLENYKILNILNNIKNKFDFICITSCKNTINNDNFNKWRFSEKNIHIKPFNIPYTYKCKVFEKEFDRNLYIYEHYNFYSV